MAEYTIQAKALNVDLEIEAGATFDPVLIYKDQQGSAIDLTGWTAKMEFRDSDDNSVLETLTEVDGIILGGTDGKITFNITKTRNIAYTFVTAKQDLFVNDGIKDYKIIYGNVKVIARVTE